jgi:hypothetical protein
MSIRDEIKARIDEGRLHYLPPTIGGDTVVRHMFVTTEIYNALNEIEDLPLKEVKRIARWRADLDAFSNGSEITMSFKPYKKPSSTFMARTDPVSDSIWDIRSRDPKPGIRVLGGFSEADVFICLDWGYRNQYGGPGSKEWRDFIVRSKALWTQLFNGYKRVSGENARYYVSKKCTVV